MSNFLPNADGWRRLAYPAGLECLKGLIGPSAGSD
jgi:hypothetical protein